eukprot:gb/GECG01011952.1/.p1 GENE.gb/GECG01011952.1/~~gb/GECG01011952.1/.p1  ORF type:complete len:974 (+),score=234.57 gb/GECG01011952.1/:1-2922(+)
MPRKKGKKKGKEEEDDDDFDPKKGADGAGAGATAPSAADGGSKKKKGKKGGGAAAPAAASSGGGDQEDMMAGLSKKERRKMKEKMELEMQMAQASISDSEEEEESDQDEEADARVAVDNPNTNVDEEDDDDATSGKKKKKGKNNAGRKGDKSNKQKGGKKGGGTASDESSDDEEDGEFGHSGEDENQGDKAKASVGTRGGSTKSGEVEPDTLSTTASEPSSNVSAAGGAAMGSGEVTLGAAKQDQELKKALQKREEGKKLSNREKKVVAKYDEDQKEAASKAAARASDKFGLEHFSVSQAGKGPDAQDAAEQNAKDVIVNDFTVTAYKKELFVNAKLHIVHGRRYGLVGPNGQGKSTLLKAMGARQLAIPDNIDVLYVEQEVMGDDTRAVEAVLSADEKRSQLLKEEKEIDEKLDKSLEDDSLSEDEVDKLQTRLNEIYEEMAQHNTENAEPKARKILAGLGFTEEMQERPTKHFSGGWRMRISLARALFLEPTLLLLDEPTNHLDLNAVLWLDDYLRRWKNTLLVVSHDQDFLSSVVTDIIHLENKQLNYYRGDYESFKAQHKLDLEKRQKEYEKQQKQLRSLKQKGYSKKEAEEKAKKVVAAPQGKKKGQEEVASADDVANRQLLSKVREYTVRFDFDEVPELAPPIIEVRDASFRYGPQHPLLFNNISFGIDQTSRISIVGPNGVGKSTLIRLLTGDLEPTEGEIIRNRFLRIGVYSQHFVDILPMDKSPVEFLQSKYGDLKYQDARNLLGRFGLEGHAHTISIADLSGGQKSRVVFANLNLLQPHLLFLDEPTNHLDIESIDALADALTRYNGGVVLVSHDARLIQAANCILWVCDKQTVLEWDGDFDDYRDSLMKDIFEQEKRLESEAEKRAEERMERAKQRHAKIQEARKQSGKALLSDLKLPSGSIERSEERQSSSSKGALHHSEAGAEDNSKKKQVLKDFFKAPKSSKKKEKKASKKGKEEKSTE